MHPRETISVVTNHETEKHVIDCKYRRQGGLSCGVSCGGHGLRERPRIDPHPRLVCPRPADKGLVLRLEMAMMALFAFAVVCSET